MEIRRLIVRPDLIDDADIAVTPSYRIVNADGSEEILSDRIHGFQHLPGTEQEIEVKVERLADPPAGGSSLRYELVRIIAKRPV